MRTVISLLAEDDLARIYGNIAATNPEAAERFKTEKTTNDPPLPVALRMRKRRSQAGAVKNVE